MTNKKAWAIKYRDGSYRTDSDWSKKTAIEEQRDSISKIVRIEIREIKQRKKK